jgi:transcription antitermination factor NusG
MLHGRLPESHVPVIQEPLARWYAVYTRTNHEKKVAEQLAAKTIESYLPTYQVSHTWKNRCKVQLDIPLFRNYVFARFAPAQCSSVLNTASAISIVGSGSRPAPLQDAEIEILRAGLHLHNAEPHRYVNIGDRARIKMGPLAGLDGIVLRKSNGLSLIMAIHQIAQSISVEVEESMLQLLD